MNYGKEVKKAKAKRIDHRKAKLPILASRRPDRDSDDFITVEREHDPLGRFGASLGAVYFDSDGDGKKDTYGKNRRTGSVGGLLEIPTFNLIEPPISGPSDLTAVRLTDPILAPISGPSDLSASFNLPISGPNGLNATINIPLSGPSSLSASINPPASGPTSLSASEGIPDAPSAGPSGLTASIASPSAGPSGLSASINAPANGPASLSASINAPASGPTGLSASEGIPDAPAEGPSSLVAGIAAPASGPSNLAAGIESPVAGPSGLSAELATLNIEIVSDQSFADSTTGADGEIKYSSDVEYLFIYDSAEGVWHRTNGGNS